MNIASYRNTESSKSSLSSGSLEKVVRRKRRLRPISGQKISLIHPSKSSKYGEKITRLKKEKHLAKICLSAQRKHLAKRNLLRKKITAQKIDMPHSLDLSSGGHDMVFISMIIDDPIHLHSIKEIDVNNIIKLKENSYLITARTNASKVNSIKNMHFVKSFELPQPLFGLKKTF